MRPIKDLAQKHIEKPGMLYASLETVQIAATLYASDWVRYRYQQNSPERQALIKPQS